MTLQASETAVIFNGDGCDVKLIISLLKCLNLSLHKPGMCARRIPSHIYYQMVQPKLRQIYGANTSETAGMGHVVNSESASTYDNISLHSVVKEDDAEKLEYLLGQLSIDLNYRDKEVTALYLSLKLRRSDSFIIRLIEAGCDPNLTTENHDSPLHLAVKRLTTKVALKLIEKCADVNAVDDYRQTPLHHAVENNNLESVCMLLYYGANVYLDNCATPIEIALIDEKLEIVSLLVGYYDTNELLLIIMQGSYHTCIESKLMIDLINAGANVNCTDCYGSNLLECSIYYNNDELFKLVWSRFDYMILLKCKEPFLRRYITHCRFPSSQWLQCLYLILESPIADVLSKSAGESYRIIETLVNTLIHKKIEHETGIGLIYFFLSLEPYVYSASFTMFYYFYGFEEELDALIYCSSTNLNNYWSPDVPIIIKTVYDEIDMEDIFQWSEYKIEIFKRYDDDNVMNGIAETLRYLWLPAHVKAKLFDLFEGRCDLPEATLSSIAIIRNEAVTVPSLCELSRNQTRKYIRENFKIEKTYQFYDVLRKLKLPRVIYDIISFKKPIYHISKYIPTPHAITSYKCN